MTNDNLLLNMNVPIIGEKPTDDDNLKNVLMSELVATVSRDAEIFRGIIRDIDDAITKMGLPDHALQVRLLKNIETIAEKALTEDPLAGAVLQLESAAITRYLKWLKHVCETTLDENDNAVVAKAVAKSLEEHNVEK